MPSAPNTEDGSSSRAGWRPDIQGLRALAVLLVIAYHADLPIPGGFIGVDVFFVISGYVITLLLLRQQSSQTTYRLRRFWAGRIRRILPALATVVIATLLLSALLEDPSGAQQQTGKTAIAALLMVSNIFLERSGTNYFLEPTYVNPLLNTWSLGVEEQFYLLFPLLLFIVFRWSRWALRSLSLVIAFIIIGSFALSVFTTFTTQALPLIPNPESFAFYSVTTRAWQFGVGALLAVATVKGLSLTQGWRNASGLSGVALVAIAAFALDSAGPYPGFVALLPTLGTAGLIAAGIGGGWVGTRTLDSRSSQFIGDRSYSLYLWHWPLLVFAGIAFENQLIGTLIALFLTLVLSMATYSWIENPFRFAEQRKLATVGGLGLIAVGLVVSWGFAQAVKFGWGQPWTLGAHQAMQRDCDNPPLDPDRCRWGADGERPLVLVVGDSQAWASGDAVIESVEDLGGSTVISSYNNCPFTAGLDSSQGGCSDWQESVLNFIANQQPDAVVIANATYSGGITAELASDTMSRVAELGASPIFLLNPPGADGQVRRSLLLSPPPDRSLPPSESQFTDSEIDRLRTTWGYSSIIDPTDVLCTDSECTVARGGTEYYTDGNHLSIDGAALLKPQFYEALAGLPNRR